MTEDQAQGSSLPEPGSVVSVPVTAVKASNNQPRRLRQSKAADLGPGQYCWGTGRRKSSVARVRIRPGSGKIMINQKELDKYFAKLTDRNNAQSPLVVTENLGNYDVFVNVNGGGTTGQAGAIRMGMSRALVAAAPETFDALRNAGFLTRDSRMVERKKYGQKKARKSFQFSKR